MAFAGSELRALDYLLLDREGLCKSLEQTPYVGGLLNFGKTGERSVRP